MRPGILPCHPAALEVPGAWAFRTFPVARREPADVEVRAGPPHVRGVGLESLDDLLQFGGELGLGCGLALLPCAGLVPDRPPPPSLGPRRVDGNPAFQLNDLAAAAAGGITSGTGRKDLGAGRSIALLRPKSPARTTAAGLWGFCGDRGAQAGRSRTVTP